MRSPWPWIVGGLLLISLVGRRVDRAQGLEGVDGRRRRGWDRF